MKPAPPHTSTGLWPVGPRAWPLAPRAWPVAPRAWPLVPRAAFRLAHFFTVVLTPALLQRMSVETLHAIMTAADIRDTPMYVGVSKSCMPGNLQQPIMGRHTAGFMSYR